MRAAVQAAFVDFTTKIEGCLTWLYLDVKCLVTTGIGDLVDPIGAALALPWVHRVSGEAALPSEITAAWQKVKGATALARLGGKAFEPLTDLRLTPEGVSQLVWGREHINEDILRKRWPAWDSWPADAQMAGLSCAWAAGASWHAPHLDAALAIPDFDKAAGPFGDAAVDPTKRGDAWLDDIGNPGLRPRNLANKVLFSNAAVVQSGLGPYNSDTLYYPSQLAIS